MFGISWYSIFYLFSVMDRLGGMFIGLTVLFGVISAISIIVWMCSAVYEETCTGKRWAKVTVPLFFLCLALAVLLPNKKDMLLIVAGGAVGEFVTSNKDAKAIPAEVTRWLRLNIQNASEDLDPAFQARKAELMKLPQEELAKRLLAAGDSLTR